MNEAQRKTYNAYQARYRSEHRDYFREASRKNYEKVKSTDGRKYTDYKSSANTRGIDFQLSKEQFSEVRSRNCVYCGIENSGGIDRVNNDIGYLPFNVAPCCGKCNRMKLATEVYDFVEHCKRIAKYNSY